jgi:hypothetical protein
MKPFHYSKYTTGSWLIKIAIIASVIVIIERRLGVPRTIEHFGYTLILAIMVYLGYKITVPHLTGGH